MHHTIEELWHGNIDFMEKVGSHPIYRARARAWLEAKREFCTVLNEKEKAMFETLCEIDTELDDLAQEIAFTQGFRLGVRLLIEACKDF